VALAHAWTELEAGCVWAREQGGRKIATAWQERESDESGSDSGERKTKGNGVNPTSGRPIYRGGPLNLSVVVPSIQFASTAISREVREKIKADFSLTDYSCDLIQPNNRTTSDRPDDKHVLQDPTSH
jgi:hypothetical protein